MMLKDFGGTLLTWEDTYFCIAEVNVGLAADVRRPQWELLWQALHSESHLPLMKPPMPLQKRQVCRDATSR